MNLILNFELNTIYFSERCLCKLIDTLQELSEFYAIDFSCIPTLYENKK